MKLERIAIFPALVARVVAETPETFWRQRPADGSFSLVEHIWHLGDLEREGFGERIERLLTEHDPLLADFPGDAVARERNYIELAMTSAVVAFQTAREENVRRLSNLRDVDWTRAGSQEHVGPITLGGVLDSMFRHDVAHANEIYALLTELDLPVPEELTTLAALEAGASSAA